MLCAIQLESLRKHFDSNQGTERQRIRQSIRKLPTSDIQIEELGRSGEPTMITSEIEARKTGHETKGILTAPYPFSWKALVRIPQTYCRFHNNYTNVKTEEFFILRRWALLSSVELLYMPVQSHCSRKRIASVSQRNKSWRIVNNTKGYFIDCVADGLWYPAEVHSSSKRCQQCSEAAWVFKMFDILPRGFRD